MRSRARALAASLACNTIQQEHLQTRISKIRDTKWESTEWARAQEGRAVVKSTSPSRRWHQPPSNGPQPIGCSQTNAASGAPPSTRSRSIRKPEEGGDHSVWRGSPPLREARRLAGGFAAAQGLSQCPRRRLDSNDRSGAWSLMPEHFKQVGPGIMGCTVWSVTVCWTRASPALSVARNSA